MNGRRIRNLVIVAAILALGLLVFQHPLRVLASSRTFPVKILREYQQLCGGEPAALDETEVPCRTGKVIVLYPSINAVYFGAGTEVMPWTDLTPNLRSRIAREIDPPRIHEAFFDLDPSIRAASPDEVDTVVFCTWCAPRVGTYSSTDPDEKLTFDAKRMDAILKAYDRKSGDYLGSCRVLGEAPPEETTVLGQQTGNPADVAGAIAGMPLADR